MRRRQIDDLETMLLASRFPATGTRVPQRSRSPPIILPINRSSIGARVERISFAMAEHNQAV